MSDAGGIGAELAQHRKLLFGLCYRMTGSAAEAEDVVQDTMVRALERPPREEGELRPWLVRVAMNLAKDRLRARKRRAYKGPWIPSPLPTEAVLDVDDGDELPSIELGGAESPARRYEIIESVSLAFLLALEVLTPTQRAVLLLCDVFDHSVKEAALALGTSEGNVKVVHHRARKALADYDSQRQAPDPTLVARTRMVLQAFLAALATGDEAGARALMADDALSLNDSGGEFLAAGVALRGPERILKATFGILRIGTHITGVREADLNGLPAVVLDFAPSERRVAPRVVMQIELDAAGKIRGCYTVLATPKLTAVGS